MRWLRFTIAQLMVLVFFVGVGFAALRNANEFWASAMFTVAIITVSIALAVAALSKGKARVAWAGYAVTGWACLIIWLATPNTVGYWSGPPRMLVYWGLYHLQASIQPMASGAAPFIFYAQISHSLEVIFLGLAGAVVGRLLTLKDDRPNP